MARKGLNELNALSHPGNFLVITTKFGLRNSVERKTRPKKECWSNQRSVLFSVCDTVILSCVGMSRQKRLHFYPVWKNVNIPPNTGKTSEGKRGTGASLCLSSESQKITGTDWVDPLGEALSGGCPADVWWGISLLWQERSWERYHRGLDTRQTWNRGWISHAVDKNLLSWEMNESFQKMPSVPCVASKKFPAWEPKQRGFIS